MRGYWLCQYEKTIDVSSLQAKLVTINKFMMQPDGMIYIWNNLYGHAMIDLYSGQIISLPVPSFASGAYRGGTSSVEAAAFYNRKNGRWTYLAFDNPNKVLYAVTNWGGIIRIGSVNIGTQLLEIQGSYIMSAKGDWPMIVNAWIDETMFLFMHADGSVHSLNLLAMSNSQITPVPPLNSVQSWMASYDGYVHPLLSGGSHIVGNENNYPSGTPYPINGAVLNPPNSFAGTLLGGIGNFNVATWNIINPTNALQIDVGALTTAPNGPLGLGDSNIWDNGNYVPGAIYFSFVRSYIQKTPGFYVSYHGSVAMGISQNASNFIWDLYLPGPETPMQRLQFPRLVNYSRPISPIGAWIA